ncbi:MAG: hypothetical protein KC457_12350 [Myxococcales bacterium]|nr:hypothetical protein [Myxococcales bacterium]
MIGHFMLESITTADLNDALAKGARWSELQHGEVGWNTASRSLLAALLRGQLVAAPDRLPPHRQLIFPTERREQLHDFLRQSSLLWGVTRYEDSGFESLCDGASAAWGQRKRNDAVLAQLGESDVRIAVFYQAGYEMI